MDKEKALFFKLFGKRVNQLRKEKEWTLEDMVDFEFSAQHFQKVEKGKKEINLYTAVRIANAFNISLSSLFKGL